MDWPRDCHTEWNKPDGEAETSLDIPYMRNLKRHDTNELVYKTEADSQNCGMNLRLPGERWGGRDREFEMDMYTVLYLKWVTNKDLLSTQSYVAAWMEGEFGE